MKSHHFTNYLEIEHSHSEPNRFAPIGGGARGPEMDDRNFDNYGRIVPAPGSTSTQADMPHEMMMGKIKPRNLDFFDFPHHQDMPELNTTSYRENENMWAVIGESRD